MIKYGELGWTKVGAGHYFKHVGSYELEIKRGLLDGTFCLDNTWTLYFDGKICVRAGAAPATYLSFEQAVLGSEHVGPCKDCGKIYGRLLNYSDGHYCRCTKCARFHAELDIAYSEAARVVRRIDGIWEQCDKIRSVGSTREAVEQILAGDI